MKVVCGCMKMEATASGERCEGAGACELLHMNQEQSCTPNRVGNQ